jgi:hypothetical protein
MENISPSIVLLLSLKQALERGLSIRTGIERFISSSEGEFRDQILNWYQTREKGVPFEWPTVSIYRKSLVDLMERGLRGEAVFNQLCSIEPEMIAACEEEITKWANHLPIKLLIPLLLFQFPAFLILLFGPLLKSLLASF